MNQLQKPVNVSPVIKFSRWTLLGLGVIYGNVKFKYYTVLEKTLKSARDKKVHELNEYTKAKAKKMFEDFIFLWVDILKIKLPPDWKPPM